MDGNIGKLRAVVEIYDSFVEVHTVESELDQSRFGFMWIAGSIYLKCILDDLTGSSPNPCQSGLIKSNEALGRVGIISRIIQSALPKVIAVRGIGKQGLANKL